MWSFGCFVLNVLIVSVFYDGRLDEASPSELPTVIASFAAVVPPLDAHFEGKGKLMAWVVFPNGRFAK
jgi:hypothetical protein